VAAMEIISNIALISINETLIAQLISFLIFLFIINRIMFRPLQTVMSEREGYMDRLKSDISEAEETLQNVLAELEEKEAAARAEAMDMRKELEEFGSKEASKIFSATRKDIASMKEQTRKEVEVRLSEARKQIKEQSEDLSVIIMEKVLDRRLASS
jgi:F-type H+-transporting ATPase subunit b